MMKKFVGIVLLVLTPLFLAGCEAKTTKADKKAVVVCHSERYAKAGAAARAAGGTFYTCGGKNCIITSKTKIKNVWVTNKASKKDPGEFTISKGTKWSTSGCGTIYRKRAK